LKKERQSLKRELKRELIKADTTNSKAVRVFDYPIGFNQQISRIERPATSGVSYSVLRQFSVFYPIARACINHLKAKITALNWDIAPLLEETEPEAEKNKRVEQVKEIFKKIGGNYLNFRSFVSTIIEDLTVLDAVALYKKKTLGGKILHYIPVDGATIKLLINEDGTRPEPPEIAYQQIIRGTVAAELTADELLYEKLYDRTNSPYGLSPLESLIVTISTALKTSTYNLGYLSEGNVPEGFIELPPDIANSPEQVKEWQDYFDSLVSGDPRFQRRLKTVPSGVKYTPTKKAEDMSFERFEQWLLQNTCAIFGVPPQDIGFTMQINKATSETQHDVGTEKGTMVISNFLKEVFDKIIQEDLGYTDLQFVWTNLNPTNQLEEVEIADRLIRVGALSVDEYRVSQGLEPIGLTNAVYTQSGPILIEDILNPAPPPVTPSPTTEETTSQANTEAESPQEDVTDETAMDEETKAIKAWRNYTMKNFKKGKIKVEKNKNPKIHPAIAEKIEYDLQFASDPASVKQIFDRYLNPEGAMRRAALKLNAELNELTAKTADTN